MLVSRLMPSVGVLHKPTSIEPRDPRDNENKMSNLAKNLVVSHSGISHCATSWRNGYHRVSAFADSGQWRWAVGPSWTRPMVLLTWVTEQFRFSGYCY